MRFVTQHSIRTTLATTTLLFAVGSGVMFALPETVAAQASFETTEVAPDVYKFRWQSHNGMFLVTDEGVVVFFLGMD